MYGYIMYGLQCTMAWVQHWFDFTMKLMNL